MGTGVNIDLQKLSLHSGGAAGVFLADHLAGSGKSMVLRFEDYMFEDAASWILKEGIFNNVLPNNDRFL